MNKTWKLVLLLTGIFLAGGVAGSFLTVRFGREWIAQRAEPEQWANHHIRKLTDRLELKPAQVDELKPIIQRNMEELVRRRSDFMAASRTIFERMEKQIADRLTPEQRIKFEEYNREKRERMKKRAEEIRARGDRPDDGPRPPPPGGHGGQPPPPPPGG